jgi:hypothetical protein
MSGRSSFIVTCTGFLPKAFVSGRAEEINMQFYQPMHNEDFKDLSRAILAWCRHFGADVGERETAIFCSAQRSNSSIRAIVAPVLWPMLW